MSHSKLEIRVGNLSFSGEGEQAWLTEQLEKVLKVAPNVANPASSPSPSHGAEGASIGAGGFNSTLASYIREKGGDDNQVDRFLITADWLRRRGAAKLITGEVIKALAANQQKRLINAADSLNKNVAKGYCEKTEGGFFITPDGLRKLGYR